jgi:hypothetical protein
MAAVRQLNAKAEVLGRSAALAMSCGAAKGLYDVMKTNLGPKGTIKMLVGGAGGGCGRGRAARGLAAEPALGWDGHSMLVCSC